MKAKSSVPKRVLNKVIKVDYRGLVTGAVARPVAFIALFATSGIGVKHLLNTLDENVAVALTLLLVFCLCHILFIED